MKSFLERLPAPSRSIRALVLAALTSAGCTYNTYNVYSGENPDGGDVLADSSRDGAIATRVDGGTDSNRDGSFTDASSDRPDTGDVVDAGRDVVDADSTADASLAHCQSVIFPGLRGPVHVGDRIPVNVVTFGGVPARTYGVNNVVASGVSSESPTTPFETPAITQAGTRSLSGYVIDTAGHRSDCLGSISILVE